MLACPNDEAASSCLGDDDLDHRSSIHGPVPGRVTLCIYLNATCVTSAGVIARSKKRTSSIMPLKKWVVRAELS
jgi:hypothetical protein